MNQTKLKSLDELEDFSDKDLSNWGKYINEHELDDSYIHQLRKVWYCEFCKATHYILKDGQTYTEGGDTNKIHIITMV